MHDTKLIMCRITNLVNVKCVCYVAAARTQSLPKGPLPVLYPSAAQPVSPTYNQTPTRNFGGLITPGEAVCCVTQRHLLRDMSNTH